MSIPVIAIDGPTASGKGTVAGLVAARLDFVYLDSGAIYRVLAVGALNADLDPDRVSDMEKLEALAADLPVSFQNGHVFLGDKDVSLDIRSEQAGVMASRLAAIPVLRLHLLQRQRDFRQGAGLVADGRDMGSVVFPDAKLKVFLTASAETRAQRRHAQLIRQGAQTELSQVLSDLQARDQRDMARSVAPLKPCEGAKILDCSALSIDQTVQAVLDWYQALEETASF